MQPASFALCSLAPARNSAVSDLWLPSVMRLRISGSMLVVLLFPHGHGGDGMPNWVFKASVLCAAKYGPYVVNSARRWQ